jgi:hypothetical protein
MNILHPAMIMIVALLSSVYALEPKCNPLAIDIEKKTIHTLNLAKLRQLGDWIRANKRWPSTNSGDATEKRLGIWVNNNGKQAGV